MRAAVFLIVLAAVFMAVVTDESPAQEKIDAAKLVGKWASKEGAFVIEFKKDGGVTITAGGEVKVEGTYTVEGDQLKTVSGPRKATSTIKKLTDTELVIVNEEGKEETLVRAKAK